MVVALVVGNGVNHLGRHLRRCRVVEVNKTVAVNLAGEDWKILLGFLNVHLLHQFLFHDGVDGRADFLFRDAGNNVVHKAFHNKAL